MPRRRGGLESRDSHRWTSRRSALTFAHMPRSAQELSRIAASDLAYAVWQLIAQGKTSGAEIRCLAGQRAARVAAIEAELRALQAGQGVAHAPRRGPGRLAGRAQRTRAATNPKRRFTMTPRARAARKVQDMYLGRLRKLKGADRAKVKAVTNKEGVAEAVRMAHGLLSM